MPIFVAVIGATASVIATAYSLLQQAQLASLEAENALELQTLIAQQELIKLAVSAEEDRADANIDYLIAADLVPDYEDGLNLAIRQGKSLSAPSSTSSQGPNTVDLRRIILHWTAGPNTVTEIDRKGSHEVIAGDGTRVLGFLPPEANLVTSDGQYVAHTRAANAGAIGLSMAGMQWASEAPFDQGDHPITNVQVEALCDAAVDYSLRYNIPILRETVLTHAEVEGTLGIKQSGKWDVTWLPGMDKPGDPIEVGDRLRKMISTALAAPAQSDGKPASCVFE